MTGEEMERAIEFLLQSQASFETRLERTDQQLNKLTDDVNQLTRQVTETSQQLQAYAQTQSEFIEIVTRTMTGLAEAQARTDERLNALIDVVQQGRSGK